MKESLNTIFSFVRLLCDDVVCLIPGRQLTPLDSDKDLQHFPTRDSFHASRASNLSRQSIPNDEEVLFNLSARFKRHIRKPAFISTILRLIFYPNDPWNVNV